MKNSDLRTRLQREHERAKKKNRKTWAREAIDYSSFNAANLDRALVERKQRSVNWREAILKCKGALTEVEVKCFFMKRGIMVPVIFRLFKADDEPVYILNPRTSELFKTSSKSYLRDCHVVAGPGLLRLIVDNKKVF